MIPVLQKYSEWTLPGSVPRQMCFLKACFNVKQCILLNWNCVVNASYICHTEIQVLGTAPGGVAGTSKRTWCLVPQGGQSLNLLMEHTHGNLWAHGPVLCYVRQVPKESQALEPIPDLASSHYVIFGRAPATSVCFSFFI